MKTLNSLLSQASRGNADAAYEAAMFMMDEQYHDVIVQNMLKKSAALGCTKAKRALGLLGLSKRLVTQDSTTSHTCYIQTFQTAYYWLEQAYLDGDVVATLAVGKCLQHGIGVRKDRHQAEQVLMTITDRLNLNLIPVIAFIDTLRCYESNDKTNTINELLVSQEALTGE